MWETWVRSLGWEDSLEKEMATHSSTLALKIPWMEELGAGYYPWCYKESGMTEWLHFHFSLRVRQKGQGSLRQGTTYVYNNKTSKNKGYSQRNRSIMESKLTLPGYNSPLSMSIPQSCGKRQWQLFFLSDGSLWECLPSVPGLQMLRFVSLCSSWKCVHFIPVDLEILNLNPTGSISS